jgi:hypothetical protein
VYDHPHMFLTRYSAIQAIVRGSHKPILNPEVNASEVRPCIFLICIPSRLPNLVLCIASTQLSYSATALDEVCPKAVDFPRCAFPWCRHCHQDCAPTALATLVPTPPPPGRACAIRDRLTTQAHANSFDTDAVLHSSMSWSVTRILSENGISLASTRSVVPAESTLFSKSFVGSSSST